MTTDATPLTPEQEAECRASRAAAHTDHKAEWVEAKIWATLDECRAQLAAAEAALAEIRTVTGSGDAPLAKWVADMLNGKTGHIERLEAALTKAEADLRRTQEGMTALDHLRVTEKDEMREEIAKVTEERDALKTDDREHRKAQADVFSAIGSGESDRSRWPDEIRALKSEHDAALKACAEKVRNACEDAVAGCSDEKGHAAFAAIRASTSPR